MKKLLTMVLSGCLLLSLTACGSSGDPETVPPEVPASTEPAAPNEGTPPVTEQTPVTEPPKDERIRVSSTRELLERIAPDASIVIEPGFYNMSQCLEEIWAAEGEGWNDAHPYVQLRECFDGVEVVIRDVTGLNLSGGTEAVSDTELVTDPRYSTVMTFTGCGDLSLSNLTMGHTERGDCEGNVINLYACRDVSLYNMDLYGCGVYGLGCYEGTGQVSVSSCVIRECANGPLEIYGCDGGIEFRNCRLIDSAGYSWYEDNGQTELAFYGCEFGDNETSGFMFREDVYTEDCIWSENYIYPDVEPDDYEGFFDFDLSLLEPVTIEQQYLVDTVWGSYCEEEPMTGALTELPYPDENGNYVSYYLELNQDGKAVFWDGHEEYEITWGYDKGEQGWLRTADERLYCMTPFMMVTETGENLWLLLELEDCLVWMY